VAQILEIPYDLMIVRKIKIPYNPEAGFGAITSDGTIIFNETLLQHLQLSRNQIDKQVKQTRQNIEERIKLYELEERKLDVKEKHVILVDDGLASGFTMIAAIKSLKDQDVKSLIVAVPTAPDSTISRIEPLVREVVCPNIRTTPFAVADAYKHWYDVDDKEALQILKNSRFYLGKKKN